MRYEFGGLIFGGAYFQNFTVFSYIFFNRLYCFRLNTNFMLQMLKKVKLLMIRQKMNYLSFELLRFFISKVGLGTKAEERKMEWELTSISHGSHDDSHDSLARLA